MVGYFLTFGAFRPIFIFVISKQFLASIRRLGRKRGIVVTLDKQRGKGSHALLVFGGRSTFIIDRPKNIGPGLLKKMCRDLGIAPDDLK